MSAPKVPLDKADNYSTEIISERQRFVREQTGADVAHVFNYSIDARGTQGNVENFIGIAQVPIGLAGPIHVDGVDAQGDFYIPLATTEGTLVASYNRGHEGAQPLRWREDDGHRRSDAASARLHLRRRSPSARLRSVGRRALRRHTSGRRVHDEDRQARRNREIPREQVHLPSFQFSHRRRGWSGHGGSSDVLRVRVT